MMQIRLFRRKGRQSIRIPSEFALPDDVKEVTITKSGTDLIVSPVRPPKSWKDYFERGPWVSADFMRERVDPPPQERDLQTDSDAPSESPETAYRTD